MPQEIRFISGIPCTMDGIPNDSGKLIEVIDRDKTDTFTNSFGPFYSVEASPTTGNYGGVRLRFGDGTSTGHAVTSTYLTAYNGKIDYGFLNEVWGILYDTAPVNIAIVPFKTQLGDTNYLCLNLGKLSRSVTSGGTIIYSCAVRVDWATDYEDFSTYTNIAVFASGSVTSNGNMYFFADAALIRDDILREGANPTDFPLDDIGLVFTGGFESSGVTNPPPVFISMSTNNAGTLTGFNNGQIMSLHRIAANGYGRTEWIEMSPEVGPPSESGGYLPDRVQGWDTSSDQVLIPGSPTLGVSNVGFIHVYNTGTNSLTDIGTELFPPLTYNAPTVISGTDVTDAIVNGFNAIVTFLANIPSFFNQFMANSLINYVIDCHMIPVSPGAGVDEAIKVGYKTLTAHGGRLSTDYVDFPCGSISLGEFYGSFADYLATGKLYLPFVGFVPTRPEWFTADTLSVDYKFNIIDGSFTCYVRSGGKHVGNGNSTIVAQYGGNACIHLPITGVTYSNMVSGLIGAGAGMMSGVASGNIPSVATSAISAVTSHGDIACSNSYNGSAAFLGCRYPFLMIERPVSSYSKNYQHEIGLPANIYAKLGDVFGFIKMENVHLDGIDLTEDEKNELQSLLASGVIN